MAHTPFAVPGRIDWTKPNLRTVYLVEGCIGLAGGVAGGVLRWCGPKVRTGSGFLAYKTLDDFGNPLTGFNYAAPNLPANTPGTATGGSPDEHRYDYSPRSRASLEVAGWEARLRRGKYDQSLGGLKRAVQRINDVSFEVDIGHDDLSPGPGVSLANSLRDKVLHGRWRGQRARLIVVDLDDIDRFEVLVDGTWDRDPDEVTASSFKMTIVAGEVIPPTKPWFMWRCPETPPSAWSVANPTAWRPSALGRSWPQTFEFGDATKGLWIGPTFGGDPGLGAANWVEIIPYGYTSTHTYAIASPAKWSIVYDILTTDSDGKTYRIGDGTGDMSTQVSTAPQRGPVGTLVKYRDSAQKWRTDGTRVFARVGGVGAVLRPPQGNAGAGGTYTAVADSNVMWGTGENNHPWVASNRTFASSTGTGAADPYFPAATWGEFADILRTIFEDEDFGVAGSGPSLHSRALPDLAIQVVLLGLSVKMACRVPLSLVDERPTLTNVLNDLMQSIPADLVLRWDDAAGYPRYYIQVRRAPGHPQRPDYDIKVGDLYRTDQLDVKMLDDPDGYYGNAVEYEELRNNTGTPPSGDDLGSMPETEKLTFALRAQHEQGAMYTNQEVASKKKIKHWAHATVLGRYRCAEFFLSESARPQKVIEADHGPGAMAMSLGETLRYDVAHVLPWVGQIRGMRLDLDRQIVSVKTYHFRGGMSFSTPPEVVVDEETGVETIVTGVLIDRAEQDADRATPPKGRHAVTEKDIELAARLRRLDDDESED